MRWLPAIAPLLCLLVAARPARADAVDEALRAACAADPRLDDAAREALVRYEPLDPRALGALAGARGLWPPSVRAWVGRGTATAVADASRRWALAQGLLARDARCAVAHADDRWALVVAPRVVELTGVVARAAVGETQRYGVALPPGASGARLVVLQPDDRTRVAPASDAVAFRFASPGRYRLQLLADTAAGPLPFAAWEVCVGADCDVAPDRGPDAAAVDSVGALRTAINRARAAAGVSPLRADPVLDSVAREWAQTLAAHARVAHALAPGDSPVARVRAAFVAVDRVAENVARAGSLDEAHRHLAQSPSHQANRLDETLDALGVGTAVAGGSVYLVELYARHPRIADR